jgi:peptide deformylase
MAILNIIHYPYTLIYTVAKPVAEVNNEIRTLVTNLAETMYDAPGVVWRQPKLMCTSR